MRKLRLREIGLLEITQAVNDGAGPEQSLDSPHVLFFSHCRISSEKGLALAPPQPTVVGCEDSSESAGDKKASALLT
jgi:hypothetical protein